MFYKMNCCALAAATLLATPAFGATPFGEGLTLTGFGTLGITSSNTDDAQFRTDLRQPRGAGKDIDFGVDSKIGLQADAKINDTFNVVGQMLFSRRMPDSAAMEWLYGQAKLPAGFDAKLGRMVLPTFMVSDSRSVGYAAHWLRAPQQVYSTYAASSFDGGQLAYRNSFGPVNLTLQLSAGRAKIDAFLLTPISIEFANIRSVNTLLETGDWLFRVGQTTADGTVTGLPIPPTAKDTFNGIGLQYDNGKAIVMTEYTERQQDGSKLFDSDSWYVSGGWRFGNWTPYVSLSRFIPKGTIYRDPLRDSTQAIGVRWNAAPNLAVKAQIQNSDGIPTNFIHETPAFATEHPTVQVMSLAVDFVF